MPPEPSGSVVPAATQATAGTTGTHTLESLSSTNDVMQQKLESCDLPRLANFWEPKARQL